MATEVNLPALGESVTEGTVTRWLKQVGDKVAVDEPLLEVSTDKVDTEIPSPVAGTLLEIKADEDETVEVGAVLGVIGDEGESAAAPTSGGAEAAEADGGAEPERRAGAGEAAEREREPPRPSRGRRRAGARAAGRAGRRSSPAAAGDASRPVAAAPR